MKIRIENVAKVKHAEIKIDGITVIAGYNGTGKSTVCKALYSICTAFGQLNQSVAKSKSDSIYNCVEEWDNDRNPDDDSFYWSELAQNFFAILEQKEITLENMTKQQLVDILEEYGIEADWDDVEGLYEALRKIVERPFIEDASFVIERVFVNCFGGQLNTLGHDNEALIGLEIGKAKAKVKFRKNKLIETTCSQIPMDAPVYIETNSYLDMLMMQRRRRYGMNKIPFNALFKSKEEDITLEKYNELKEVREICAQIMNEVTHGELVTASNREIIYKEEDIRENILCSNIASGLKNILIIQKMLDNGFLNSHSLLLIDEPEVNLHPEWQVKFAEILVLLYKKLDIRIVLNTHSPYFMRAIETKLAEHEIADKGRYYYMDKNENFEYISKEVTGKTEVVYETMYRPLEAL